MAVERATCDAEKELGEAFDFLGFDMPDGLRHIVLHHGTSRKEVYRCLWGSLMFVNKLNTGGTRTLVYPEEVRDAVRRRFGDPPDAGAYDRQYVDEGYHVTLEELARAKWRPTPKICKRCNP